MFYMKILSFSKKFQQLQLISNMLNTILSLHSSLNVLQFIFNVFHLYGF